MMTETDIDDILSDLWSLGLGKDGVPFDEIRELARLAKLFLKIDIPKDSYILHNSTGTHGMGDSWHFEQSDRCGNIIREEMASTLEDLLEKINERRF